MKRASRLLALSGVLLLLGLTGQEASPPDRPRHGLLGHYYTTTDYHDSATVDEFWITRPIGASADTRIDPQVAFGKGRGFEWDEEGHNKQSVWWTPQEANGVIWKGYVRLPKAGTYYFSTVSNGPSAVYLNRARVWLNGFQGGNSVPGEVFSYVEPGSGGALNPEQKMYVVPITVEREQILPIEVRYLRHTHRGGPRGIDLYWVTPDSPTDADAKPIAEIVPTEALYVDPPPSPAQQATTSGIHCTISSDFLYFPAAYGDNYVTLTIRLADEQGRPLAGHRVHVSGLVSYGGSDEIVQPEKPTDARGITTARVRAGPGHKVRHDSRFYATDVTDLVSVAQVCHVRFITSSPAFLPLTYAPYYDDKAFLVEPMPLRVGTPARITIPLENRSKRPAELTATFLTQGHNIGASDWGEVAKVQNIRLEPGERREVSAGWTPRVGGGHVCIKAEIFGRYLDRRTSAAAAPVSLALFVPAENQPPPVTLISSGDEQDAVFESVQRNLGSVEAPTPSKGPLGGSREYWEGVKERATWLNSRLGFPNQYDEGIMDSVMNRWLDLPVADDSGAVIDTVQDYWGAVGAGVTLWKYRQVLKNPPVQSLRGVSGTAAGRTLGTAIPKGYTGAGTAGIAWGWVGGIGALGMWLADQHLNDPPDPAFLEVYGPPDSRFERVAEATAAAAPDPVGDALDAFLNHELKIALAMQAALVALERYEGAVLAGNAPAAERQYAAYVRYVNQSADAFAAAAPAIEAFVAAMRGADLDDIVLTAEQIRAHQRYLAANGVGEQERLRLALLGLPQEAVDQVILPALLAAVPDAVAGSFYEGLLERAAYFRRAPTVLKRSADELATATAAATALSATSSYVVGNPTDKEATVELYIRRASIPPEWKLSIVDEVDAREAQRTRRSLAMAAGAGIAGYGPAGLISLASSASTGNSVVQEVKPGEHYRVHLPAGGSTRVRSVLTPVGPVGQNTTARWAVEGRIGDELIGGMMHEMHVPAAAAAAVAAAELESPQVAAGVVAAAPTEASRWLAWAAAAMLLTILVAAAVLLMRRKRSAAIDHHSLG